MVQDLADELEYLYDEEDRDYDPEALAEEVIDSWLETPAGQQFNLFDRDQR